MSSSARRVSDARRRVCQLQPHNLALILMEQGAWQGTPIQEVPGCSSTCHIVILCIRAICHSHDSPDYANLSQVYSHLLGEFVNN